MKTTKRTALSITLTVLLCMLNLQTFIAAQSNDDSDTEMVLSKEIEVSEEPRILFSSEQEIRRLLGKSPIFVYNAKNRRDPMIVPWIQNEVIAAELIETATKLKNQDKLTEARSKLMQVISQYPKTKQVGKARKLLQEVNLLITSPRSMTGQRIEFPLWIKENTKGLIWDAKSGDHVALVGEYILKQGEQVPNFDVTVQEIQKDRVIYNYEEKTFEILLERKK